MAEQAYVWRDGVRFAVNPQIVGDRLDAIGQANGGNLRAEDVVEDARSPASPLHPCFTWDVAEAAHQHWLDQARSLIRSVRAVHMDADGREKPIQGYVNVVVPEVGRCYVTTARAVSDDDLRQQMLDDALRGIEAWQRRYAHLGELQALMVAVEQTRVRVARQVARAAARQGARREAAAV